MINLTDLEFLTLSNFVRQNYGLDLTAKKALIEGRLSSVLVKQGFKSFGPYIDYLKKSNNSADKELFLNKITTNYSFFGREFQHFDYLMQKILPQLERSNQNKINIWSAGCSGGQEAFTIAMCLDQYFSSRKSMWDIKILATDISNAALTKGMNAVYSQSEMNSLPASWQMKYFNEISSDKFKVSDNIRKDVSFRSLNLMQPLTGIGPFDIIFCRNVMIYFDKLTTQNLVSKFFDVSKPSGYFFTSHSEVLDKTLTPYKYCEPSIYQKIPK